MKEKSFLLIPFIILFVAFIIFSIQGIHPSNFQSLKLYQNTNSLNYSTHTLAHDTEITDDVYVVIEPNQKLGSDGQLHDTFIGGDIKITKGRPVTIHFYNYDKDIHSYSAPELGINVLIKGAKKIGSPQETKVTFTPQEQGVFPWTSSLPYDLTHHEWAMSHNGFMKGMITVLPSTNQTQYISLAVNHAYKLAKDGHLHDAYTPGDFTVRTGRPIHLTIYNYSNSPHPFGITLLNVNIPVNKRIGNGIANVSTGSFIINKSGHYQWNCLVPCDEEYHQYAMLYDGYMIGVITAK